MAASNTEILVLYYSSNGSTAALAAQVARGVNAVAGASARVRTVPGVSADTQATQAEVPDEGPPFATIDDLGECDGIVLGSPTRFGNMSAALKYFIDGTSSAWLSGRLHGGQETTLMSMALPLLHHGMFLVGIPYSETALSRTRSGGTPYGATHVAWEQGDTALSDDEIACARTLGSRVADAARRLKA